MMQVAADMLDMLALHSIKKTVLVAHSYGEPALLHLADCQPQALSSHATWLAGTHHENTFGKAYVPFISIFVVICA